MFKIKRNKLNRQEAFNFEKRSRFGIRKLTIGVVSLVIGSGMVLSGVEQVQAGTDYDPGVEIRYVRNGSPKALASDGDFKIEKSFVEVNGVQYVDVTLTFNQDHDGYARRFLYFNMPKSLYEPEKITRELYWQGERTPRETTEYRTWQGDYRFADEPWYRLWDHRYIIGSPDSLQGERHKKVTSPTDPGGDTIGGQSEGRWNGDWDRLMFSVPNNAGSGKEALTKAASDFKATSRTVYINRFSGSTDKHVYKFRARVKDGNAPMNFVVGLNEESGSHANFLAQYGTTPDTRTLAEKSTINPPARIGVNSLQDLSQQTRNNIAQKIREANPDLFNGAGPLVTNVTVSSDGIGGNAVLRFKDGSEKTIPMKQLVYKINTASGAAPTAPSTSTNFVLKGRGVVGNDMVGLQGEDHQLNLPAKKAVANIATIGNKATYLTQWQEQLNKFLELNKQLQSWNNQWGFKNSARTFGPDNWKAQHLTASIKYTDSRQTQIQGIEVKGVTKDSRFGGPVNTQVYGLLTPAMLFYQEDPLKTTKDEAKATIDSIGNINGKAADWKSRIDAAQNQQAIEAIITEARNEKNALDKKKAAAIQEINALPHLSQNEKTAAINAINSATTTTVVDQKLNDAKALNTTNMRNKGKEAINALSKLNDGEKTPYRNRIDNATTQDQINAIIEEAAFEDLKRSALEQLDNMNPAPSNKDELRAQITETNFNTVSSDGKKPAERIEAILERAKAEVLRDQARRDINAISGLPEEKKNEFLGIVDRAQTPSEITNAVDQARAYSDYIQAKDAINQLTNINNKQKEELLAGLERDKSQQGVADMLTSARALDGEMKHLKDLVAQAETIKQSSDYSRADRAKQNTFNTALDAAKRVSPQTGELPTTSVGQLISNLTDAIRGLGGTTQPVTKDVDKGNLRAEIDRSSQVKDPANAEYTYASEDKKQAYEQALTQAIAVRDKANPVATQAEVDAALAKLQEARIALDGHAPDRDTTPPVLGGDRMEIYSDVAAHAISTVGRKVPRPNQPTPVEEYGENSTRLNELIVTDQESGINIDSVTFDEATQRHLQLLGLKFVKYDRQQDNGAVGYFTTIEENGVVNFTGTGIAKFYFTVANTHGVVSPRLEYRYILKDDIAPTATPTEHVLIRGQEATITIPIQDNSMFGTEGGVSTGTMSIRPENNTSDPLTPAILNFTNGNTPQAFTISIPDSSPEFVFENHNYGKRSRTGTVSLTANPSQTLERTTYKFRVADGNTPRGTSEKVTFTDITFTVVDRLAAPEESAKVSVNNPSRLTEDEKNAIKQAVRTANPHIAEIDNAANGDTNKQVRIDVAENGRVTVTYPHGGKQDTLTADQVLRVNQAPVADVNNFGPMRNIPGNAIPDGGTRNRPTVFVFAKQAISNDGRATKTRQELEAANMGYLPITDPDNDALKEVAVTNFEGAPLGSGLKVASNGTLSGNAFTTVSPGGGWVARIVPKDAHDKLGNPVYFHIRAYTDKLIDPTQANPVEGTYNQAVTAEKIFEKLTIDAPIGNSSITVPDGSNPDEKAQYTRTITGYKTTENGEVTTVDNGVAGLPKQGTYFAEVTTTNIWGQTIKNYVKVVHQEDLAARTDLVAPEAVQVKGTTVAEDEKQTIIDALKAANPGKLPDDPSSYSVAPNGTVTVTYSDNSSEPIDVPLKSGIPTVTAQPHDIVVFKNTDMTTPVELAGFTDNESIKDIQIVGTDGSSLDQMGLTVDEKAKENNVKSALISGKTNSAVGKHTRKLRALDNLDQASAATNDFSVRIVDATVNQPETAITKEFGQALTPEEVRSTINFNVGSGQNNLIDFDVVIPADAPTSGKNVEVPVIIRTKAHASASEEFKRTFVSQDKTVTVRATWPTQADNIEVTAPADTTPVLIDGARPTSEADKTALIDALKEANKTPEGTSKFPENTRFDVAENGAVTITYPDRSSETVTVPFKQKDSAQHTPTVAETPINSAATAGTPLTEDERNAVKAAVTVPNFPGDRQPTVTVPENARVTNGTEGNTGKPVVVATVEYPDGSSETVEVPVKQRDNAKYEATISNPETPAAIKASHASDTAITDEADKNAILAKVSVPEGSSGRPSLDQNPVVEERDGKQVVKVTVTYPDQTTDTVYVPVDQKDNETHNPTAPAESVKLDAPATANSTLSDDDKAAVKAAVTVPDGSRGEVSLPEGAKVELVGDKPVVKATVTYPDGTTDIVDVPVVQKDSTKYDATASTTPVPLDSPVTPGQTLSAEEREALKFGVNVPAGSNGQIHVPENAAVKLDGDKPVVEAEVRYPDGTVDKVQVPVRQYDRAVYTPNLVNPKEVPISVEPTNDTQITSPDDAAILANVDVPAAGTKPEVTKTIASPVKDGTGANQGKKVVEVEITYPDKSKEKIEVPVKHADNQVHNPEAPTKPVQLDVAATTDTSLSDADKQAVKDAVTIPQGSGGVASLPEDAKVVDRNGTPVVPVTVTYPDGTTETVDVPVVQKDSTKHTPVLTEANSPVLTDTPAKANEPVQETDKAAIAAKVDKTNLPQGTETKVPDDAVVELENGKPVVPVLVSYPDGTSETIKVPVDQKDDLTYNPVAPNKDNAVAITSPQTPGTEITDPTDKAAILDSVTVPAVDGGQAPKVTKEITSPVTEGPDGPYVTVKVSYPDGTSETVNVPVNQKDNETHNPTAPAESVKLDAPAVQDGTLSEDDKKAVKDAVVIPDGSGGVASLPEDAKVELVDNKPVVPVTVTYPDNTKDTVYVPVVQKDSVKYTPSLTDADQPVLTDTPAKAETPVQDTDKAAIAAKVDLSKLPENTTAKVPDGAKVELDGDKPVVPVLVSYPDGTSETIKVPVDQKDSETYTPTAPAAETPVAITGSDAPDAPIAETDKPAILNSVTVPAVDGGQAPKVTKEITSPVKVVDGKAFVEVTVTYPDDTYEKVNVPVNQKDNEANDPTVTAPEKPAPISVPVAENTPVESDADKKLITDKVNVAGLPNPPQSVKVAEPAKVVMDQAGNPVVNVEVTYPDGTKDIVPVPVKQADNQTNTPSLKEPELGKPAEVLVAIDPTPGVAINNPMDKEAIAAKVDLSKLPAGTTAEVADGAVVANDPLTNKPVVPVTVTYPDGTSETINVPVKQADNLAMDPSLKDTNPVPILTEATVGLTVSDKANLDAIVAKVDPKTGKAEVVNNTIVAGKEDGPHAGQPVVNVLVTYPDGTQDTIEVPVKQADNVVKEPSLTDQTPVPIQAAATTGTPVPASDKQAILDKVEVPEGANATIADDATVVRENGQPVVPVTVTYPDGTTDTISVPVKRADNSKYTPSPVTDPVQVDAATAPGTAITSQDDKDAIIAAVPVPKVAAGEKAPVVSLPENPRVEEVNGQPVVKAIVTYADGTTDTVDVPIVQKVSATKEPSLKEAEAGKPAQAVITENPTAGASITDPADQNVILDKVVVPEGGKASIADDAVVEMDGDQPVLPVTVTYTDGSKDIIKVPVKQADNVAKEPSLKSQTPVGVMDAPAVGAQVEEPADLEAIKNNVDTKGGTASIEDPTIVEGPNNQPAVAVKVTYPDGTADTILVPIKTADNVTYTPVLKSTDPVLVSVATDNGTAVPEADQAKILANVDVPALTADGDKPAVDLSIENPVVLQKNGQAGVEVTVTYPDGSKDKIFVPVDTDTDKDGFSNKEEEKAGTSATDSASTPDGQDSAERLNPGLTEPVEVKNPDKLTDAEKEAVKKAVEASNDLPAGTTVSVANDGTVTVTYPDNSTDTIQPKDAVTQFVDTDGDGISDRQETENGTDPSKVDSDNDGFSDKEEVERGTDPTKADSKPASSETDTDGDGISNEDEATRGTDPNKSDTDGDGFSDQEEITAGSNPTKADSTPANVDKDGDGFTDTEEAAAGTDANNPSSTPEGQDSAERLNPGLTEPVEVKNSDKLTDAEKEAVKKAVEDSNDLPAGTTVSVANDGTVTVTYPDKSTDTIQPAETVKVAKDTDKDGFTDTEEATAGTSATDPSSTPAGQDSAGQLTPSLAEPVEVKNPDKLTDAEKESVKKAVEDSNDLPEGTEVTVSDNGTVTVTYPDKSTDTIQPAETVKVAKDTDKDGFTDTEEATAGTSATDPSSTPAGQDSADRLNPGLTEPVEVKNPDKLTDAEKESVKRAVEETNDLPAGTEVSVSDSGTVTVTYPDKSTDTIQPAETVKVAKDTDKDGFTDTEEATAGTDATNPSSTPAGQDSAGQLTPSLAEPVEVKNPDKLTDAEKESVKKAVEDSNDLPEGTEVSVSDNGTVTVTYPDKSTDTIQPAETVKVAKDTDKDGFTDTEEEKAGTNATDPSSTPAGQDSAGQLTPGLTEPVEVKNPDKLTDAEKDAVKKAVEASNDLPEGTEVTVSDNGTVTVTYPDKSTDTIQPAETVKVAKDTDKDGFTDTEEATAGTDATNPASTPAGQDSAGQLTPSLAEPVEVKNPDKLTDAEKESVKKAVEDSNDLPEGTEVSVSDNGTVTVTYPDKSTDTIQPAETVKVAKDTDKDGFTDTEEEKAGTNATDPSSTPAGQDSAGQLTPSLTEPVEVKNPDKLTDAEKEAVKKAVEDSNDLPEGTEVTVSDNGTVTVTYPDKSADTIQPTDTVKAAKPVSETPVAPSKPEVTATDSGAVVVTPPTDNVTNLDITFTPEGASQPVTVVVSKDENGIWTAPADSGLVINSDGTITIPAEKVADGTAVTVVAENGSISSPEVGSTVVPVPAVTPETPVAPSKPEVTATDSGAVVVTPPTDNVTNLDITFTPEGSSQPVTVVVSKDATGTWTAPADSGLVVNPDGTITIPAENVADGTAVTVVAENGSVSSPEVGSAVVPVPTPELPAIPAKPTSVTNADGSVTIVPPVENVTGLDITFTPEGATEPVTVTLGKDATGAWTAPADSGLVVNPDGTITIPADRLADGTEGQVGLVAKNGDLTSNDPAPQVPETPAKSSVETNENGSVTIVPPVENVTGIDITFTPEGASQPVTVVVSKDATGAWTAPADSGLVVNPDGTITIPADKVADGTAVSVVTKNGQVPSDEASATYVPAKPASTDTPVVEVPATPSLALDGSGNVLITPPAENATSLDITFTPAGSETPITVTANKDATGNWILPETSIAVVNPDGTISISTSEMEGGTAVSVVAKNEGVPSSQAATLLVQPKQTAEELAPTVKKPIAVEDASKLTDAEKKELEDVVRKDNVLPEGTEVSVADDGTVTVTYPDKSTDTILPTKTVMDAQNGKGTSHSLPAYDLTADEDKDGFTNEEELKQGSNVADAKSVPAGKSSAERLTPTNDLAVKVKDLTKLSDAEKETVETAIRKDKDLPEGTQIEVANDGSVTITYPDGSIGRLPADQTVLQVAHGEGTSHSLPAYDLTADEDKDGFTNEEELKQGSNVADAKSVPAGKSSAERLTPTNDLAVKVKDLTKLTDAEKKAVETAIRKNNTLPEGTQIEVANDGSVTITYPDGSVDQIVATKVVATDSTVSPDSGVSQSSGTTKVLPGSASSTRAAKKPLPATGENGSPILVLSGLALLAGVAMFRKAKREDEN
ncbi:Rib/alpha-like domain-containing protein [Streptococcus suis]|uniref:Rib/alpha-like domain-containing protein n=3 Tax=Streptococcus suis TaxID=1307 RepID=UPI00137B79B5|nr:Rib/alpha-like domain-containing protein [Streptococcus suis]